MSIPFVCPHCGRRTEVADEYAGSSGPCAGCGKIITMPAPGGMGYVVPPKKSSSTTVIIIVVAVVAFLFCGGILAGLLLPAIQATREAARRAACMNHLSQIGHAVQFCESRLGQFPAACTVDREGRPMHSWRVAILPELDRTDLYSRIDFKEPWDSPKNRALANSMPDFYRCPSDSEAGSSQTSYMMIVGKNTMGGEHGLSVRPVQILDGNSRTLLVVEVPGMKVDWMEPKDITLEELARLLDANKNSAPHVRGFNVVFCDGSVRCLPTTIDRETLRRLAVINDGQTVNVEQF